MVIKFIFGQMKIMNQYMCIFLKALPRETQLKYGLPKIGGCVIANNNSRIPKSDLKDIMKTISLNFLYIVGKWKEVYGEDDIKFYC